MGWALDIALKEYKQQLKAAGLSVNVEANVLVTPKVAIRLPIGGKTDEYRRIFRDIIQKAEEEKKAKLQAKQTKLL